MKQGDPIIQLEDKVKCKYTGFTGIAVARTEFLNGCVQIGIAPKWDGKTPLIEEMSLDEQSLIIVKKGPRHEEEDNYDDEVTGGPNHKSIKMRGY